MKVCVIGLGYIGLPTSALLASTGFRVVGVDVDPHVVSQVNLGKVSIYEPGLEVRVHQAVANGNLRATAQPEEADVFLITVPTPFKENKAPDLSFVYSAVDAVAPCLKVGDLLVLESTSPVSATAGIANRLSALRPDLKLPKEDSGSPGDIAIAYCPERVLPGKILEELVNNDRIIGGLTENCASRAAHFYRQFVKGECIKTDARTAALCKLTENAYRDTNIAFANEISMICDELDIDVSELRALANRHPRVNILSPGVGVGGHCIAVDPWFIVDEARNRSQLIQTSRAVNDRKTQYLFERIKAEIQQQGFKSVICYGISYKPDTDDLRCSPALKIVAELAKLHDITVYVVEPNIQQLPTELLKESNIKLISLDNALREGAYHVGLVAHAQFVGNPDLNRLQHTFDATNMIFRQDREFESRELEVAS